MSSISCLAIISLVIMSTLAIPHGNTNSPWRNEVVSCKDFYETCVNWKNNGECVSNPTFMDFYCRESCQKCGIPMAHPDEVMSNPNGPPGFQQFPSILTPGWNQPQLPQKK